VDISYRLLDGAESAASADAFRELALEVYADQPYRWDEDRAAYFSRRFAVQRRQPGFVLAEAKHGEYLVGFACGLPLRPSTDWWRGLTTALPPDVTTEYPGRSFALTDLLVRAPWRRQYIGETLHDLILRRRREERATATVLPAAAPAQGALHRWGWQKVARSRDQAPGAALLDVLVREPPAALVS
jgi:hypothetical protein